MGRHAAPTGPRPAPQESEAPPRSATSHRAHHRAASRRRLAAPTPHRSRRRVSTLDRPQPKQRRSALPERAPEQPAGDHAARPSLAARVAALPRVLLDTVAWGGFAAVVALVVIALSDVGIGRAALWAGGLGGIIVLAVGLMAVTGTRLEELGQSNRAPDRPD